MSDIARIGRIAVVLLALGVPACGGASASDDTAASSQDLTQWGLRYAQLAETRVPTALEATIAGVAKLGPATLPHEAKTLRKQIGELRDMIDLFSYVYDKSGPGDPWVDVRDVCDEGYEKVGAFKDLFDAQGPDITPETAQYDDREVKDRRDAVLKWKTKFTDRQEKFRAYLSEADHADLHERKAKDQSQFFWGGAGVEPKKDATALENFSSLTRALLERAEKDFDAIRDLDEVTKVDDHEQFHDLRKRVRSIVKVVDYFPELLEPGNEAPLALMRELVDRYGALNDLITAHDLARDQGKKEKRKELADKIEDQWKELRQWQKAQDVKHSFDALRKHVKKHG